MRIYGPALAVAVLTTSLVTISAQSQTTQPQTTSPRTDQSPPTSTARTTATTTAAADEQFVKDVAAGSMTEVALGRLATDKASSAKVKEFAGKIVTDHGKANDELKSLAAKKNITLPASIDAKHQAKIDKLSKLSGTAFDRAFITDMLTDHQADVAKFRKQAQSGADADIKAWAAKTLPTFEAHLKAVEDLNKQPTH